MSEIKTVKCHCGGFEAEISLPDGLKNVLRCNCSICSKKGAIMVILGQDKFKITKGNDLLTVYQFHSKVAKHYFCSVCGIYTHHNPRKDVKLTGVNVSCIENVDPFELKDVKILDGKNHPLDKKW